MADACAVAKHCSSASGTRVFKKTSPNGKITTYLGKRDFIDRGDRVDLIDGMVLIDDEYIKENKKITAHLLAAFRYGREDLDVLGLTFRKDLISQTYQVFPVDESLPRRPLTRLQERLKRKLGENAFPFWFEVQPKSASSVTLQEPRGRKLKQVVKGAAAEEAEPKRAVPLRCQSLTRGKERASAWSQAIGEKIRMARKRTKSESSDVQPAPGDTGKPCGVDYELKTVVGTVDATNGADKPHKHNSVRLAIRKLTYAPWERQVQPMVDVSKEFMMSPGLLHMETSLDKEMYYHGESLAVNVHIQNNSNKTVKKLKVCVVQVADICLFTTASYTCEVARLESTEGFPVGPGATLSKVFSLCPLLSNNKDKRGLALDGQLKHEDTNLASSTILDEKMPKENLGIVVQYKVKVRAQLAGALGGELVAELPFTLTHSKPCETPERKERSIAKPLSPLAPCQPGDDDIDLIQWGEEEEEEEEGEVGGRPTHDDDLIFEDFTRLRLQAADSVDDGTTSAVPVAAAVGVGSPVAPFVAAPNGAQSLL